MDTETAYSFRAVALKKVAHHPDGVLWPRQHPGGIEALPVVLLEVQICDVTWVDLAVLASQPDLDPLLALLTLPVQKKPDLGPCAQRILELRPDLIELIVPILSERFQGLSPSQIMATLGISKEFWRHTRAFQDILAEGREEGREEGRHREASTLALRQLERRCGSLDPPPPPGSKPSASRNWKSWPWPCSISEALRIYKPGWSRWKPEVPGVNYVIGQARQDALGLCESKK